MRRLKSLLLMLLALWLPLQAAAAVTMPFCRPAAAPESGPVAASVATPSASAEPTPHCHELHDQPPLTGDLPFDNCDNCEICHLASAGFLLAIGPAATPATVSILVPHAALASASHIPEPPQQPPRR